jgi:drug/metabolite transporter (DMT)-like permease
LAAGLYRDDRGVLLFGGNTMSPPRIFGIVALVVGIVLLVICLNSSNSVTDQVTHGVLGRFTQATTWYIVGGIALGLFGLLMSLFGPTSRSA